jgi:hypothetical protein
VIASVRHGALKIAVCALLSVVGGCHRNYVSAQLTEDERGRLYSAVLTELGAEPSKPSMVVDTLLPAEGFDAEIASGLVASLAISRADVAALMRAQQRDGARIGTAMLPDSRWRTVSVRTIDSVRAVALRERQAVPTGQSTPAGDAFWRHWRASFPASRGYVIVSPAGVSADGGAALVHVRTVCGPVCNEAEVRLLRRDVRGVWHTVRRVPVAIS